MHDHNQAIDARQRRKQLDLIYKSECAERCVRCDAETTSLGVNPDRCAEERMPCVVFGWCFEKKAHKRRQVR